MDGPGVTTSDAGDRDRPAPRPSEDPTEPTRGRATAASTKRRWIVGITLAMGAVLLISSSGWITARFGENHDGRNAAVWGEGSRAIRTEGIRTSRFGGVTPSGAYANHPPGIVAETLVAELVAGEHRVVTRAPAWIGSIVAIALLALLLLDADLAPWAVAAGMAVALSSAMFTVYGSMLDTPVTALPFTLAMLVLVQRAAQERPAPWWAFALAGAGTALSGWEAVFFTAAAGVWLVAGIARRRRPWSPAAGLASGSAIGLAITFGWILWVYDGYGYLRDNAQYRTSSATLTTSLSHQLHNLGDLVPLTGIVGLIGLVVAACTPRLRSLAAVTLLPVVAYAMVFKGGADIHDYWSFPVLIALALGATVLLDRLAALVAARDIPRPLAPALLVAALVVGVNLSTTSNAELSLRQSLVTPGLLDVAVDHAPATGPVVAYLSDDKARSPWISYESQREGLPLDSQADLAHLAARHPDFPVLVALGSPDPAVNAALRRSAYAVDGFWAVVPAGRASAAYRAGT